MPLPSLGDQFRVALLPRWRAIFAIVCAGAAVLCAGGMLEYGTGSPETQGTPAATYWALLFGLHVVAFGGATLLAAFPPLARPPIKLAWVALALIVAGLAYAEWQAHQPSGAASLTVWLTRSTVWIPAAITIFIGLLLPPVGLSEPREA